MKVKCITGRWNFFTLDKEYEVIRKEDWGYVVYADDGVEVILSDHECEVIEESNQQVDESVQQPTQEPTREFKVGDKVKIVKKFTERGWLYGWACAMNETIGKTSEILELGKTDKNSYLLCVDGDEWWYPEESLELIEEAKQDKIREEPVQCNEAFEDYSSYPHPVIVNAPLVDFISYQEFLDAFDEEVCPSITARKHEVFVEVNDQSFMCYTKEREQEVMKALIVLFGKREGEN